MLHAIFARILDESEVERVFAAREMVDATALGTAFRNGPSGPNNRYGIAFHSAIAPGITFSIMAEIDIEGTVALHGPNSTQRISPGAGKGGGS